MQKKLNSGEKKGGTFSFFSQVLGELTSFALIFFLGIISLVFVFLVLFSSINNHIILSSFGLALTLGLIYVISASTKAANNYEKKRVKLCENLKEAQSIFSKMNWGFKLFLNDLIQYNILKLITFSIVILYVYTFLLIEVGSLEEETVIDIQNLNINIGFLLMTLGFSIYSLFFDIKNSKLHNTSIGANTIFFIGVIEFYKKILIFFTGIFGGKEAFVAAKNIDELTPIEAVFNMEFYDLGKLILSGSFPFEYEKTYSYSIFNHLGGVWFILIYLILPLLLLIFSSFHLMNAKKGIKPPLPLNSLYSSYYLSILLIIIMPGYICWNEGWIQNLFSVLNN
jgi:hypothetical protein